MVLTNRPTTHGAANDIYAWSRYTPLTKVRVVIIGQDPYHGPGEWRSGCGLGTC